MNVKNLAVFIPLFIALASFTGSNGVRVTSSVVEKSTKADDAVKFSTSLELTATDSILRFWLAPQTLNSNKPVASTFYF